jgi:hypothetical protein
VLLLLRLVRLWRFLCVGHFQQAPSPMDALLHGPYLGIYPVSADILPLRPDSDMHCETSFVPGEESSGLGGLHPR